MNSYDTFFGTHDVQALQARLASADPGVRRVALMELADSEDETHLSWLLRALEDPVSEVRGEVVGLLAGWEQDAVIDGLAARLADDDEAVRQSAAQSLAQIKTRPAGLRLLPLATHADAFVRAAALRALRELRLPEAAAAAQISLHHPGAGVRREAVGVLGWLKHVAALPDLAVLATGDADPEVRRAATGALGLATDDSVLPPLLAALHDTTWQVREEAATTLGKLRPSGGLDALIAALDDNYWQVRLRAARALGRLGRVEAVPQLSWLLQHEIANLRKEAAIALGEIGSERANETLLRAESDPDPDVRKAVRLALIKIEAKTSRLDAGDRRV